MSDSCLHGECLRVLNVAAWLTLSEPGYEDGTTWVDLAVADASLNRFSLNHDLHDAVVYMRHDADGDWFAVRVSQVTDSRLLAQLGAAAELDQR